ncbi:MAG: hypothetical protein PHR36_04915 [Patescibacteria group bacterium]|nr:hypothetical protein [Patescibacteria group bacterium]
MLKKRLIGYAVAIVSLVLNYFVFFYLAKFFGSTIPEFIALALTVALFTHELCHMIAYELMGIPSLMVFLVIIGGAGPIPDDRILEKVKRLGWEPESAVILAGVCGNFLVIIGTYLLWFLGYATWDTFLRIMNLNAVLILWNLFPIGKFDGGQFAKRLFDSISENRDTKYEVAIMAFFVVTLMAVLFISGKYDPLNLIFMAWGLHYWANHDDPSACYDSRAIPESRQKYWATFYLLMISMSAIMVAISPQWLKNP